MYVSLPCVKVRQRGSDYKEKVNIFLEEEGQYPTQMYLHISPGGGWSQCVAHGLGLGDTLLRDWLSLVPAAAVESHRVVVNTGQMTQAKPFTTSILLKPTVCPTFHSRKSAQYDKASALWGFPVSFGGDYDLDKLGLQPQVLKSLHFSISCIFRHSFQIQGSKD